MNQDEHMEVNEQLLESLQRLAKAELTMKDRANIWGGLDQRMSRWEQKSNNRIRSHRLRRLVTWSTVGVTAAGAAGFLAVNLWKMQAAAPGTVGSGNQTNTEPLNPVNPVNPANPANTPPYNNNPSNPPIQDPAANQPDTADTEQRALIQKIANLAKEGLVPDCKFAADKSLMDVIEKEWGKPAQLGVAGKGLYATYPDRGYDFGFNKGAQVFDVRSYTPAIKQIKYSTLKQVLGEPVQVTHYVSPNQNILIYKAGEIYELQFIFPEPTTQVTDPTLDHISVFCPKDATPNSMAQ